MEKPSRYRNKMVFPVGNDGQKSISGFYAPHSHDVIPMGDCKIGDELNNEIIRAVTEFMDEEKVSAYDEKSHTGVIRRIFTRKSFCDNEMMVVICANTDKLPSGDKLIQRLRTVSDKIVSIILNVNTQRNGAVITEKNITLWGKDRIGDSLCGVKFMISPQSFFQVNPIQAEKLYNKVLEYAAPNRNTRVLDIYCGIGTISLCAAKKAGHVTGVEIVERAIIDAKENAAANGIENAEFFAASAQTLVPRLIDGGAAPDIVILDPPRKGSDKATLSAIASAEPEKVVYVSCDCATLARDARFLADNGYKIEKAAAVDMFPHTAHIETVVLMTRGK
jgi:23S rRNA (uracil1939-C5)-methyltransferase